MNRIQAKEKINKLLKLANDKGATESERSTALEMANKIASKHGYKIQKVAPQNSTSDKFEEILNNIRYNSKKIQKNRYEFDLNCFNKKHVTAFINIIGFNDYFFTGKKTVIIYTYKKFDVEAFKKFYKDFVSHYYKGLKKLNMKEKDIFAAFFNYIEAGYRHENITAVSDFMKMAFNMGIELSYIMNKEV